MAIAYFTYADDKEGLQLFQREKRNLQDVLNINNQNGALMEMTLVLRVNPQCLPCRKKLEEVLHCTNEQYTSFVMDAEAQKVKITGRVDPVLLMQVLSRLDGHAEVVQIQLNKNGDSVYDNYYKYDHHYITNYGNPYNHHRQDDPFVYNGHYQPALHDEPGYYQYRSSKHPCLCNIM